jgi:Uma2 family endonuclease
MATDTAVGGARRLRWTRDEYERMLAVGLLGSGRGYELIDGDIYLAGAPKVWTRDEYYRLGELGFRPDARTELIEGEIVEKMVPSPPHTYAARQLRHALERRLPDGCYLDVEAALALAARRPSDPVPDLMVVAGRPEDHLDEPPATALLVVEVSVETLDKDQGPKRALYARAAIPHYWVLDVLGRRLHVYADPIGGGRYGVHDEYGEDEAVALPWPTPEPIVVGNLLPPRR